MYEAAIQTVIRTVIQIVIQLHFNTSHSLYDLIKLKRAIYEISKF